LVATKSIVMRQYARLTLLTFFGATCLWLLWLGGRKYIRSSPPKIDEKKGVVDFLPRFRQGGLVDEAFETRLYDSLTELELTLRPHEAVNKWPKLIWQTSPSKGDTEEMKTWKVKNPEWRYKVPPLSLLAYNVAL
jgi:hypothetical protein